MAKTLYVVYDKNLDCDVDVFLANSHPEAKRIFIGQATRGLALKIAAYLAHTVNERIAIDEEIPDEIRETILDFDEFLDHVQRNETIEVNDD